MSLDPEHEFGSTDGTSAFLVSIPEGLLPEFSLGTYKTYLRLSAARGLTAGSHRSYGRFSLTLGILAEDCSLKRYLLQFFCIFYLS